ncbi:MAG: COG4315 family predicted lipoprotein [Acidimicrobiales bacterium]
MLTTGSPHITGGSASLVGTITRKGGARQVTYGGHPLYHYAGDSAPGQANGEGVSSYGALWYAVSPEGKAVTSSGGSGYGGY